MRWERVGIFLIVLSLGFSFSNIAFTGAVIGAGVYDLINIFAIVFFLVGVVIVFVSSTLERRVSEGIVRPSELLNDYSPKGESVFVIDTSFLSSYSGRDAKEAIKNLSAKGTLVVTDGILREMEGSHNNVRELLIRSSEQPIEGYEKFEMEARKYLESSRKVFYRNEVIPIIMGKKEAPKTRKEAERYIAPVRKLVKSMGEKKKALTVENLRKEIETHWAVSDVDVGVLAAAMAEVDDGREAYVAERDVDFEDAINTASLDNLHYLNVYGKVA